MNPLFITGLARGGTTMACRLLNECDAISLASDPLLPVFSSLRNRWLEQLTGAGSQGAIGDYYFSGEWPAVYECLNRGEIDLRISEDEAERLRQVLPGRMKVAAPDYIDDLDHVRFEAYRELFDDFLGRVAARKEGRQLAWCGMKDLWIVDMFPALSRAWSQAKFIIILRDPRAILASVLGRAKTAPEDLPEPLSVLRHWRRLVAFVHHFRAHPELNERVLTIRYEDLITRPAGELESMRCFLGLENLDGIDEATLQAGGAEAPKLAGNSSFDDVAGGLSTRPLERWRETLPPMMQQLTEYVCGAEMRTVGYEPDSVPDRSSTFLREFVDWRRDRSFKWRSDRQNWFADLALEDMRYQLLQTEEGMSLLEQEGHVIDSVLFPECFHAVRQAQTRK